MQEGRNNLSATPVLAFGGYGHRLDNSGTRVCSPGTGGIVGAVAKWRLVLSWRMYYR